MHFAFQIIICTVCILIFALREYFHYCRSLRIDKKYQEKKSAHKALQEAHDALRCEYAIAAARQADLQKGLDNHKQVADMQKELLEAHFANLSQKILEQKTEKLTEDNQKSINKVLVPLREQLNALHKQLHDSAVASHGQGVRVKEELDKIRLFYEKVHALSQKTTKAILGDAKLQGSWGEIHALQLLENAGLKKDKHYVVQKGFSTTEGKRCLPDIIIKLPENRSIIIDVKVSIVHYIKYFNAGASPEMAVFVL